jgi:hypothetical protein
LELREKDLNVQIQNDSSTSVSYDKIIKILEKIKSILLLQTEIQNLITNFDESSSYEDVNNKIHEVEYLLSDFKKIKNYSNIKCFEVLEKKNFVDSLRERLYLLVFKLISFNETTSSTFLVEFSFIGPLNDLFVCLKRAQILERGLNQLVELYDNTILNVKILIVDF